MVSRRSRMLAIGVVLCMVAVGVVATAIATGGRHVQGHLSSYQEVPAVSSGASGSFEARLARGGEAIEWRLSYSGLEGPVQQAHIHFGQTAVNGGISVWLCSNLPSPPTPASTAPCPDPPATISGTAGKEQVVGPEPQGIAPMELGELVNAIRAGKAYANVHSAKFPGGEIRAQLRAGWDDHDR
jgi:hypothetical protein